jgi:rubredoxin
MVSRTVRDDGTWYECEHCGLLFETETEAGEHEQHCEGDDASYIQ